MEKEFVTYKQAVTLIELGFNVPLISRSEAILKQQAFRWFRETNGLYHQIQVVKWEDGTLEFDFVIIEDVHDDEHEYDNDYFSTWEEAEEACLDKLIELFSNRIL